MVLKEKAEISDSWLPVLMGTATFPTSCQTQLAEHLIVASDTIRDVCLWALTCNKRKWTWSKQNNSADRC